MVPVLALVLAAAVPADRLLAAYRTAWDKGDATALAELYTADGELVSPAGTADGHAGIARLYGGGFGGGMAATVLTARLEGVRAITSNVTLGRGQWKLTPRDGGTGTTYCGRFFAVLRKERGAWRIASFQEIELACDPAAQ